MRSGVRSNYFSKSITISHDQTAQTCPYGMREMQYRAYQKRNEQYLFVKAPPASGTSRALMYIALDKVHHQNLSKVIISVPQQTLGSSFQDTKLSDEGFFSDWKVLEKYNLCLAEAQDQTETIFSFMSDPSAHYLVCEHAALTTFFNKVEDFSLFDNCLIAIDEVHHASAAESGLGLFVHKLMTESTAHLVAMTDSSLREDTAPLLDPKDEELFSVVTYTDYDQLLACKYLKKLNIDYAFSKDQWAELIQECLKLDRKTIVYVPSVQANERSVLLKAIFSETPQEDPQTHFLVGPSRLDGSTLKVADLITPDAQKLTIESLRKVNKRDDVDIILTPVMEAEGFDWPYCEHALTIGYQGSFTGLVRIMGKVTRDCKGKETAYLTNLVKQPVAYKDENKEECSTYLKALALSMFMGQALKPTIQFQTVSESQNSSGSDEDRNEQSVAPQSFVYEIDDSEEAISPIAKKMIEDGCLQIIEKLWNSIPNPMSDSIFYKGKDSFNTIKARVRGYLYGKYPDLCSKDFECVSLATTLQLCKSSLFEEIEKKRLANKTQRLIKINELDIKLAYLRSPFSDTYQILSKALDTKTFKNLKTIVQNHSKMTLIEAQGIWPLYVDFFKQENRIPYATSKDKYEKHLVEAMDFLKARLDEISSEDD